MPIKHCLDATPFPGLLDAIHLTQSGRLLEATAVIQRALGAAGLLPAAAANDAPATGAGLLRDIPGVRLPAQPTADCGCGGDTAAPALAAPAAAVSDAPAAATPDHLAALPVDLAALPGLAGFAEWLAGVVPAFPGSSDAVHPAWQEFIPSAFRTGAPTEPLPGVVPDGGRFVSEAYSGAPGSATYKLYVPSSLQPDEVLPLIVMLHGCTQGADDFAAGTRMNALAEEQRCFVAYPVQTQGANLTKCWNWFRAEDQQRDSGEPALIAGITQQIIGTYPVDARRVYVAGLSAGGAMAAIMGVTYPDLYAAIGIHSGLAYGAAQDMPSAFAAMQGGGVSATRAATGPAARRVPTIVFHGDRDSTVHPSNGDQVIAQWTQPAANDTPRTRARPGLRVVEQGGQVPNGHAYTFSVHHDAKGRAVMEQWLIHGAGHAWAGGSPHGSYTDPQGPDASQEMLRFFRQHSL